ncbi:helix-turn-helix domain-containing protein [Modestobacter sp. I12A-02628]|uniref:AraC family transcriptional regulator n=1 Tax=Goekera deserti TaxID=2497753 RepID=A0A7K3WAR4_9ACTN|nr:helix-turn-helix domain-containing protein [Goekera deserti]MPQ97589.1 helix-turn-helix domain-containing protein [Goekera deserti]NDI47807.1 helix-turn-helix domain-containing protein [Goekera deserti]NEL53555.1 AraC family transcriptional regulator [Goekera deserti]
MTVVDEWVRRRPAPPLRRHVGWYSGWRQDGVAPAVHRGLPSPWLTLIITVDEPLQVREHPDPAQPAGTFDTLLGGLHTRPALVAHGGRQAGVQLALHPLGARALLGLPAGELAGRDLPADAVLGPAAHELHERLAAAPYWAARFAAVDDVLLRLLRHPAPDADLALAWELLLRGAGVGAVAHELGWSPRRLSARFAVDVGLSPRTTARVARFHRARWQLQRSPRAPLAGLAVGCGFYDQAHLAREFRALAGLSPTRWLAEELRAPPAEG